ncbi:MAG: hypothetical protein Kow0090_04100 [Myxococcota bacterium]
MFAMGYKQGEHKGDIELSVWGADFQELCSDAVRGLAELLLDEKIVDSTAKEEVLAKVRGYDREEKLIALLNNCLKLFYIEGIVCISVDWLSEEGEELRAKLRASSLSGGEERYLEIKAATFHRLEIKRSERGLEARVVFDI